MFDRLDILSTSKTIFQLLVCIICPIIFVYDIELHATIRNTTLLKKHLLPPPDLTWAHGVDSRQRLVDALRDKRISAIETDVLMAPLFGERNEPIPIIGHPPNSLSVREFWQVVSNSTTHDKPTITKAIKLNFQEWEIVEPTLEAMAELQVETFGENGAIILHSDVLAGPGQVFDNVGIGAQEFLETCMPFVHKSPARIAFSLGHQTDSSTDTKGYTAQDAQAMADLITQNNLRDQRIGVVLALNAHQLAQSLETFDSLLETFPNVQIWAQMDKAIPQSFLKSIEDHYEEMPQRIGYDCRDCQDIISD